MPPIAPPGSATGDKPNATTFIKPQLEFFIIKLCNFESVGGATAPPCSPVATPLIESHMRVLFHGRIFFGPRFQQLRLHATRDISMAAGSELCECHNISISTLSYMKQLTWEYVLGCYPSNRQFIF